MRRFEIAPISAKQQQQLQQQLLQLQPNLKNSRCSKSCLVVEGVVAVAGRGFEDFRDLRDSDCGLVSKGTKSVNSSSCSSEEPEPEAKAAKATVALQWKPLWLEWEIDSRLKWVSFDTQKIDPRD